MKSRISILIADDHPIFRQGLRQIIESDPGLEVVAEAGDGNEALQRIEETKADIAILDVDMPQRDGFEIARAVEERRLGTGIIFLTMHKDERFFNAALDAGVKGYVIKDSAVTDIINSIKLVAAGENYISPQLSTFLINRHRRSDELSRQRPGLESLTATERRILKLIAAFKTSKEIADQLCISVRTVEHHRANITQKLDLRGSHALARFAVKHESEL